MTFAKGNLRAVASGTEESRVEALRQWLGYPLKQKDPQGGSFWFLRPGEDEEEAEETCPIAVGFYPELNGVTDTQEIQRLLTSKQWQDRIYGHYVNRTSEQQPVMYMLLPTEEGTGRVPLVLPTEGGLRQRNIQAFAWGSSELETRLHRIRQGELPIATKAVTSIPLVERAFYEPIKTAKELAQLLAKAAREIEKVIPKVYKSEEKRYPASKGEEGYLHKLLKSFQQELLPTLRLDSENEKDYSFADIYAQTIAYALFTARVFSYVRDRKEGYKKETLFDRETAWQQLPETNPFLRRLFQDVSEQKAEDLGDELIGHIADIFAILRAAKMEVILQDFRQKMNREDIVIRFYEDFLAAYKSEMRERRGVYYTPEPIVSYMVRSVDVLLKEKFNKPLGLADPEVEILDPACGTGTFLFWIFRLIHERFHNERKEIRARVGDISWSDYVRDHLLPRVYGFELLAAPYAIAHLKLGLFLEETGYQFDSGRRLEIILTNTLDKPERKSEVLLGKYISEESDRAALIKRDQPVMLVIGNPPYSYESENTGEWISCLVRNYYFVDNKPLGERNPKGLQDDYIKFIRFAQWKIQQTGQGILAFISNHSYLDNPTFRGMRQSIQSSFNTIYALNLHGSTTKRERSPDGSEDKNVFDIQQGVAVGIFLNEVKDNSKDTVFYCDVWGSREDKYNWLDQYRVDSTTWEIVRSTKPSYFLIPQNTNLLHEYERGWKINEVMSINSVGLYTARDNFVIQWDKEDLRNKLRDFVSLPVEEARDKYALGNDARDWKIIFAQDDVRNSELDSTKIRGISYRPFDKRFTYYTGISRGLICMPRLEVMQHMINSKNIALCFIRRSREQIVSNFFVAEHLVDKTILSSADNANVAPLYLCPNQESMQQSYLEERRHPNFSQDFTDNLVAKLGYKPTPEAIFYYIYAIFHSPTYRTRYAEFLKIDFPRIPLTSNDALFHQLAIYGEELVALHLMKSPKLDNLITQFTDKGGEKVVAPAHPKYANGEVTINKKGDGFTGVPEDVWSFYVGGYPVCAKWLKDRKGRTLSNEDIAHYQRIVVALQETIKLMAAIDQAIPGFPIT